MNFRCAFTFAFAGALLLGGSAAQVRGWDEAREETRVMAGEARQQRPGDDLCRDGGWDDDRYRFCEVREYTMPAGPLTVDAGRNGGISVEAWDQTDIRIRAVVTAQAERESDARQIASSVQVEAGGGRVSASGPTPERRQSWSVSFRVNVPRATDLNLSANNGGIAITGVNGAIRFETTNGGVRLADVGGRVHGATRNGGLNVELTGTQWEGEGLDVETRNGGVNLAIPRGYNAELTTGTVNGGFRIDFPMTIQGELSPRRGITTTLGSGGPPIRVRTTNGGLRVSTR
jgi:hypothetical protein